MATKQETMVINRRAFNPKGSLGSYYDACRDEIIEKSSMTVQGQGLSSGKCVACEVIMGKTDFNFNVLRLIGIEDELQLTSILSLKKRTGIATVLNHPFSIDDCTRLIYYSWISRTEEFHKRNARSEITDAVKKAPRTATHLITGVSFGIDLIIVLHLPSKTEILNNIHLKLERICAALSENKHNNINQNVDKDNSFQNIQNISVYSNTSDLSWSTNLFDIFEQIKALKEAAYRWNPVQYMLETIASPYATNIGLSAEFNSITPKIKQSIEEYILEVRNKLRYVEASLYEHLPKSFGGHLECQMKKAHNECSELKDILKREINQFFQLVISARKGRKSVASDINQALHSPTVVALKNRIANLVAYVNGLKTKGELITYLRSNQIAYCNVMETKFNRCTDLKTIESILIREYPYNRALCSNDALNEKKKINSTQLRQMLVQEHENISKLRLIYLDFSYSSIALDKITILPSNNTIHHPIDPEPKYVVSSPQIQPFSNAQPSQILKDEFITVLLVGETGVGKSTFINAFANYLTFESLTQAQQNDPVVVMPVSFIMTVGDNFDEHIVKFGEVDSLDNEHFNDVGQSVTQHCRSYLFDLHQFDGKKLRIIDTPGFGDTRGLEQDDRNMEHILQYINNLTHLNAICFLLKPNTSRLNMFFRTCLTQLFSFLAPTARENIIFCFTNGRSTFYTPGDTAPLLKTMLKSLSIDDIPFKKENTFCFDSESFRYLVALQNDIQFTEVDRREYEASWSISVKESNRLIDYIDTNLRPYKIGSAWQSIKHAQFEIGYMVRPTLEAMRNILRNIILYKTSPGEFIELNPTPLQPRVTRCRSCKFNSDLNHVGNFWIIPTSPHAIEDGCRLCKCDLDQHVLINYMLQYRCLSDVSGLHQNATLDEVGRLCRTSAELANFLINTVHSTKDDPFLNGLLEMIDEENQICKRQKDNEFNARLNEKLIKVQESYQIYQQKISKRNSNGGPLDLPTIYKLIDEINQNSMVHKQMVAVRQSQQMMLKEYEYEVQAI